MALPNPMTVGDEYLRAILGELAGIRAAVEGIAAVPAADIAGLGREVADIIGRQVRAATMPAAPVALKEPATLTIPFDAPAVDLREPAPPVTLNDEGKAVLAPAPVKTSGKKPGRR